MAGTSQAALKTTNHAAEAKARAVEAGYAPTESQGVLSDMASGFNEAIEKASEAAQKAKFVFENKDAIDKLMKNGDSMGIAITRLTLKDMKPQEMLKSMAKNSPKLAGIAEKLEKYPELAEKMHNVALKDPSMLTGLEAISKGEGNINLAKFEKALESPNNRRLLGEVFDKIAENPTDKFNFKTLDTLAGHMEKNETAKAATLLQGMGISAMDFSIADMINLVMDFTKNPQMALSNLGNKLIDSGLIPESQQAGLREKLADFGKTIAPVVKGLSSQLPTDLEKTVRGFATTAGVPLKERDAAQAEIDKGNTNVSGNEVKVTKEARDSGNSVLKESYDTAALGTRIVNGGKPAQDMENTMQAKLGNNNQTPAMQHNALG